MAHKTSPASRYRAPALDKGLDILEVLAESRLPLSQVELAQKLGRTPGEFYRMLACLEERGYVTRESESGQFKLTLRLYELSHKQCAMSILRSAAQLPMEALAEEIGQACHLSVEYGSSLLVITERMPARQICLAVGEGTVMPLVETNSGRLLVSQLANGDVLKAFTKDKAFNAMNQRAKNKFFREIEKIRAQGYALADSSQTVGVTDIATLVGVKGTDTVAALAICFLNSLNTKASMDKIYHNALIKCAAQINLNLGIIL